MIDQEKLLNLGNAVHAATKKYNEAKKQRVNAELIEQDADRALRASQEALFTFLKNEKES